MEFRWTNLVPVLMLVPVNPRYEVDTGAPCQSVFLRENARDDQDEAYINGDTDGDDESQTKPLIALPCPLVRPYLGRDFSHTFRRTGVRASPALGRGLLGVTKEDTIAGSVHLDVITSIASATFEWTLVLG